MLTADRLENRKLYTLRKGRDFVHVRCTRTAEGEIWFERVEEGLDRVIQWRFSPPESFWLLQGWQSLGGGTLEPNYAYDPGWVLLEYDPSVKTIPVHGHHANTIRWFDS